MLTSDDFVIIVPTSGEPFLAHQDDDLSEYTEGPFMRLNKTVALEDGQKLTGSVYRGRETSAADEITILVMINEQYGK